MKYFFKISTGIVLFFGVLVSCDDVDKECKCYENALNDKELSEECQELVEGLSNDDLKEKSNECFGQTVEDVGGAVGI